MPLLFSLTIYAMHVLSNGMPIWLSTIARQSRKFDSETYNYMSLLMITFYACKNVIVSTVLVLLSK